MQFLGLLASACALLAPLATVSAVDNVLPQVLPTPQFEPLFVATLDILSIRNLTGPLGTRVYSTTSMFVKAVFMLNDSFTHSHAEGTSPTQRQANWWEPSWTTMTMASLPRVSSSPTSCCPSSGPSTKSLHLSLAAVWGEYNDSELSQPTRTFLHLVGNVGFPGRHL